VARGGSGAKTPPLAARPNIKFIPSLIGTYPDGARQLRGSSTSAAARPISPVQPQCHAAVARPSLYVWERRH